MILNSAPIYLISGPPGAGKTSVAVALAQRFPFGFHISVDDLREWVVSGISHPVPEWTAETTRQFSLARRSAALVMRTYAEAGFVATLADVLFPDDDNELLALLAGLPVYKILLLPSEEVVLSRNQKRTNKTFDTSLLDSTIQRLHKEMQQTDFAAQGWLIIDSSDQTLEETVNYIIDATPSLPLQFAP